MDLTKDMLVSDHVNLIRGFAALAVLFVHIRNGLFVPYKALSSPSLATKIVYFFSGLGSEAVMIFFVLSGFLVGKHVYCNVKNQVFSWYFYLVARLVRLYVVLIPVLIFSAIMLYVSGISINLSCFSLNVLFLQTIFTSSYAGNLPLWSLCNEFWYYILFPLILVGAYSRNFKKQCLYLGMVFFVFWLIGINKALYFIPWLMGFFVYLIKPMNVFYRKDQMRKGFALLFFWGLLCEAVFSRLHLFPSIGLDFLTAICFSVFLYVVMHNKSITKKATYCTLATRISSCSYTLYLIHYPILSFIEKNMQMPWQPDIQHACYGVSIFIAIFLFSYWVSLLTEAKTNKVRLFVLEKLSYVVLFKKKKWSY